MSISEERLPSAFKKKWIAALRSKKYNQAKGLLLSKSESDIKHRHKAAINPKIGFCCIGVAGKVCRVPNYMLVGVTFLDQEKFRERKEIPKFFTEPTSEENSILLGLAEKNDNTHNWNFCQIAKWIKDNL